MAYYEYKRVLDRVPKRIFDRMVSDEGWDEDEIYGANYDGGVHFASAMYIDELHKQRDALIEALKILRDEVGKLKNHPNQSPGGIVAAMCIADDALKQAKWESGD